MFTECDPRPEPVDIARASGVIDKTFTKGFGSGSCALPAFLGAFSSLSRVAMKSRAMATNEKPSKILTKLPMIGYAVFNNKPLSASSRCLLMKDKAPRETKPAPKIKSPALVDSFSKSRGVFILKRAYPEWGRPFLSGQILELGRLLAHFSGWQRDDLQLAA